MYAITTNPNYNTLEITFDSKPAEAVREALKALSFRWHNVKKLWYGKATEEEARAAGRGLAERLSRRHRSRRSRNRSTRAHRQQDRAETR